jgi:hypothetical protein
MKDLCLTYIDNAEVIVPQMDKFKVGSNNPKQIYIMVELGVRSNPDGREIIILKKNKINSSKDSIIKQKTILENIIRSGVTGEVSKPSSVPASFSLTNNFAMTKISEKKSIIHIWMIKISNGINDPPELRL